MTDDILEKLLTEKKKELREYFSFYLRGIALYIAVTGVVIKFAFDKDATYTLKNAMSFFGVALTLVGFLSCIYSVIYQKAVRNDFLDLSKKEENISLKSDLLPFKYMTQMLFVFLIVVLVGWIYLFFY